jgi:hypothetical protein
MSLVTQKSEVANFSETAKPTLCPKQWTNAGQGPPGVGADGANVTDQARKLGDPCLEAGTRGQAREGINN